MSRQIYLSVDVCDALGCQDGLFRLRHEQILPIACELRRKRRSYWRVWFRETTAELLSSPQSPEPEEPQFLVWRSPAAMPIPIRYHDTKSDREGVTYWGFDVDPRLEWFIYWKQPSADLETVRRNPNAGVLAVWINPNVKNPWRTLAEVARRLGLIELELAHRYGFKPQRGRHQSRQTDRQARRVLVLREKALEWDVLAAWEQFGGERLTRVGQHFCPHYEPLAAWKGGLSCVGLSRLRSMPLAYVMELAYGTKQVDAIDEAYVLQKLLLDMLDRLPRVKRQIGISRRVERELWRAVQRYRQWCGDLYSRDLFQPAACRTWIDRVLAVLSTRRSPWNLAEFPVGVAYEVIRGLGQSPFESIHKLIEDRHSLRAEGHHEQLAELFISLDRAARELRMPPEKARALFARLEFAMVGDIYVGVHVRTLAAARRLARLARSAEVVPLEEAERIIWPGTNQTFRKEICAALMGYGILVPFNVRGTEVRRVLKSHAEALRAIISGMLDLVSEMDRARDEYMAGLEFRASSEPGDSPTQDMFRRALSRPDPDEIREHVRQKRAAMMAWQLKRQLLDPETARGYLGLSKRQYRELVGMDLLRERRAGDGMFLTFTDVFRVMFNPSFLRPWF